VNKILHTDWSSMTSTDWAGLITLLVIAALMAAAYFITMKPGNRSKFEQHRNFVNDEDDMELDREVKHVHTK
jgi:hypothetical protein